MFSIGAKNTFTILALFLSFIGPLRLNAQTIPVGTFQLEDYYRRQQLTGKIDSSLSFVIRPIFPVSSIKDADPFWADSLAGDSGWFHWTGKKRFAGGKGMISILPVSWEQTYTQKHPYGWNDGSMIPSKGFESRFGGGIFAKYGPLTLQLRPEVVHAQNLAYEGFNTEHADIIWAYYYAGYLNQVDIPERFGEGAYNRVDWGQSSLRLNFDPVSFGLSNENLWWGPGRRSSLLMSNNAPGFKHLTLNTTRPVKTPIGAFEAQIISGLLEGSGYPPSEPNRTVDGVFLYAPKTDNSRYLSGVVLSYQPRWMPGLFLGLSRAFQMYEKDLEGKIGDYLPFLQPLQKKNTDEYYRERDQLASVFARYLLKDSQAELYFEYGRNDHSEDLRDFLLDPEHARAYIAGFSKLFKLNRPNEYIHANVEVTQLSQGATSLLREAGAWYVHWQVRQGYTHRGQVLGAGIGPGSNLQSLNISWNKGLKGFGLQFERYIHNSDFYLTAFAHNQDFRKKWVDISATGNIDWSYRNLLINARASVIRSLNYQYWLIDRPWEGIYFQAGQDVINFQGHLGIMYRF